MTLTKFVTCKFNDTLAKYYSDLASGIESSSNS